MVTIIKKKIYTWALMTVYIIKLKNSFKSKSWDVYIYICVHVFKQLCCRLHREPKTNLSF